MQTWVVTSTEKSIEATSQYITKYQSQFPSWPSLKGKHIKARMMPFTRISEQVLHFQLCRNRAMPWPNFPPPALKYCFGTTDPAPGRQRGWASLPGKKALLSCWPGLSCTTLWHLYYWHPNNSLSNSLLSAASWMLTA